MVDSCATCFFYRDQSCHLNAPRLQKWPSVEPGQWCGEGADSGTGVSFSNSINSLAGPTGPPGPTGATGATGAAGANAPQIWINPGVGDGADGDYAFAIGGGDTVNQLQKRVSGSWTTLASHFAP